MHINRHFIVIFTFLILLLPLGRMQYAFLVGDDLKGTLNYLSATMDRLRREYPQFQSGPGRREMEQVYVLARDLATNIDAHQQEMERRIAKREYQLDRRIAEYEALQNDRRTLLADARQTMGSFMMKGAFDLPASYSMALTKALRSIHADQNILIALQGEREEIGKLQKDVVAIRDRAAVLLAPAGRPHAAARAGWAIDLEDNKAIIEDVQHQVELLQSKLKRIDAQLRARQERLLLAKGIKTPDQVRAFSGFILPVQGRVSATFLDPGYQAVFGVPHYGIDFAVPQGTPFRAAEDGVVFHVQHGGAKGYSYILLGHRGKYSTLYGHVSEIYYSPGQTVFRGDILGTTGGARGAPGSGPMTTGAHLHFEMTKDGTRIDPMSVF